MDALRFGACLPFTLGEEGGFSDNPKDPGGATNRGVTLAELAAYRKAPQSVADVRALTVADVTPIYLTDYWNAAHCGSAPAGVDLMMFEEAVNQGPAHAIKDLQQALGLVVDGDFGPKTRAAAGMIADRGACIVAIAKEREARYRASHEFVEFGKGWMARLDRCEGAALAAAKVPAF